MKARPAWVAFLLFSACASAQPWHPFLESDRAIDWAGAGVGHIPDRPVLCASLTPSATTAQINAALASCPADQAVFLAAGTYAIDGNIRVPSEVTLRGAGAGRTILNATGVTGGAVITLGGGSSPFHPLKIAGGASAGSTSILLPHGETINAAFLAITETNDPAFVSSLGAGGNCNWCDGNWTKTGDLARGQIVQVWSVVNGTTVAFLTPLYASYTRSPVAVPLAMSESAGVENLQVRANNTGYETNFAMTLCARCWIRGVASNYADGEHVSITWGYHDEVRDSYFSNEFQHRAGERDADIQLALKTTASLIENNIIERGHQSVMLEWGAAGNVIAYNYMTGAFDRDTPNLVIGGIDFHGAHPQFNLLEGNVAPSIYADPFWGTSSDTTAFRNWLVGTTRVCSPSPGRHAVDCANAHYAFQAARAAQVSYVSTRNNFLGNVLGSTAMQALTRNGKRLAQIPSAAWPAPRSYDDAAYGWTFGYDGDGDDGSTTACSAGRPSCHAEPAALGTFRHGNYSNIDKSIAWAPGKPHTLPPSLYLSAQPPWWGSLPFPATGPDVTGGSGPGGHSYGNPAQACYLKIMGGSDGGAGSPLPFGPDACYGPRRKTE